MPASTCNAAGCAQRVRRGHAFCGHHWYRLPADLRARISAANANRFGDLGELPLRDARRDARDWLTANPAPVRPDRAAYAARVQQGAYWHD